MKLLITLFYATNFYNKSLSVPPFYYFSNATNLLFLTVGDQKNAPGGNYQDFLKWRTGGCF